MGAFTERARRPRSQEMALPDFFTLLILVHGVASQSDLLPVMLVDHGTLAANTLWLAPGEAGSGSRGSPVCTAFASAS